MGIGNVYGINAGFDNADFSNTGVIDVNVQTGDANSFDDGESYISVVYGVNLNGAVGSFTNSGQISVSALTGNANGYNSYAYVDEVVGVSSYFNGGDFSNEGLIDVNVQTGNADNISSGSSISYVSGASVDGVNDFQNSGNITVSAETGSANDNKTNVGIATVSGASVYDDVNNFNNSGSVIVNTTTGDANGYSSNAESYNIKGTLLSGNVGDFNNSGNIVVENIVGNANGDSSTVRTSYGSRFVSSLEKNFINAGTYGAYIGNDFDVNTFVNSGNIDASVKAGGAIGDYSEIYAGHVLGVDIGSTSEVYYPDSIPSNIPQLQGTIQQVPSSGLHVGSFENSGTISASAEAGDAAGQESWVSVFTANSVWIDYSKVFNFTNKGTMISQGSAGSATGIYSIVGLSDFGMGFLGEVGNFTNEGSIVTEVSAGNATGEGSDVLIGSPYGMKVGAASIDEVSLKASEPYLPYFPVYGVLFGNTLYNFENSGTIAVSAEAGSAMDNDSHVDVFGVLGVLAGMNPETGGVGNFVNDGDISVELKAGDASGYNSNIWVSEALGVGIGSYMDNFTNTGAISVNAVAGDASGIESGVDLGGLTGILVGSIGYGGLGNFTNEGLISVSSLGGNAAADNTSVGIEGVNGANFDVYSDMVNNFENTGDISVDTKLGNAAGNNTDVDIWDVAGTSFDAKVDNFTNTGTISVNAETGEASGDNSDINISNITGVITGYRSVRALDVMPGSDSGVNNFTNSGNINAAAKSGGALGYDSSAEIEMIFGGEFNSSVDNLTNSGDISVVASAGDAAGDNSTVNIAGVGGLDFELGVKNAENTGSILTSVRAGDASGDNSSVNIERIAGVYLGGDSEFVNNGHIGVSVTGGKGSNINQVAGMVAADTDNTTIENNGLISVKIDAEQADSVDNVSGIYVVRAPGDTVNISNTGMINLWSSAPEADSDIRTLRIGEDSSVRLQDKFAITFGQMGVDERPIYMDNNSTLDLNDAGLIARTGTDLSFNSPYYLIENDNGTVSGEFGKLYKGFTNPEIGVSWYGSDRGENSGVVFDYNPQNSTPSLGVTNTGIIADSIFDRILSGSSFSGGLFASGTKVYYAQAEKNDNTATDAGSSLGYLSGNEAGPQENKDAVYLYPFYESLQGDDLAYDSSATGLVLGYEKGIGDRLRFGVFGGYAKGNLDFDIQGSDEEDQTFYSLGINLDRLAGYGSPWYFGLKAMAYRTNHDYTGYTGPSYQLTEDADYDSNGLKGRVTVGYRIAGSDWEIMPNVGAEMTRWKLDSFTTDASDSAWDKKYSSESNSYTTLMAGISGEKNWRTSSNNRLYLGALVRLEQVAGDNDISVDQELANLNSGKVEVEQDISDFSIVGKAELGIEIGKRYSFSLVPGIKMNSDYKSYSGQAVFRLKF